MIRWFMSCAKTNYNNLIVQHTGATAKGRKKTYPEKEFQTQAPCITVETKFINTLKNIKFDFNFWNAMISMKDVTISHPEFKEKHPHYK